MYVAANKVKDRTKERLRQKQFPIGPSFRIMKLRCGDESGIFDAIEYRVNNIMHFPMQFNYWIRWHHSVHGVYSP